MTMIKFCFSFKGRISRRRFRKHLLCAVIILIMSYFLLMLSSGALKPIIVPICLIVSYTLIPTGVKRLHDLNHPGWLILLGIVPMIVGVYLDSPLGLIITFIGSMYIGPYLALAEGTVGENNYGPSPRYEI